jgi:hypothetical protein
MFIIFRRKYATLKKFDIQNQLQWNVSPNSYYLLPVMTPQPIKIESND